MNKQFQSPLSNSDRTVNRSSSLLILIAGALLGGGLVAWTLSGREARGDKSSDTAQVQRTLAPAAKDMPGQGAKALPPASKSRDQDPVEGRPNPADRITSEADVLFSTALLELARKNIEAGWAKSRPDQPSVEEVDTGLELFRERTPQLARSIGIELSKLRTSKEEVLEDARTGGVFDVLARLMDRTKEPSGPLPELVSDRDAFDKFFISESPTSSADGQTSLSIESLHEGKPVPDGSVLIFPPGVFLLEDFGRYWRTHFPRDLTIRGAGMDATLLVLKSGLSANDLVRNLTFEYFTVHTDRSELFDLRKPSMSLTMRRVRVAGWDRGSGSSSLFETEGLALRAIHCEFLGGYGKSPESGKLFDIRHSGLLASFDHCLISRTSAFEKVGSAATVVFSNCRLEDLLGRDNTVPKNITMDASTLSFWNKEHGYKLNRDLSDIFPDWKERLKGN
ncbi:MAG: hypothetical protein ACI8X5_003268 [Planctomycetota bacterium]|jgi:hypothetical protein